MRVYGHIAKIQLILAVFGQPVNLISGYLEFSLEGCAMYPCRATVFVCVGLLQLTLRLVLEVRKN